MICDAFLFRKVFEDKLCHRTAANVAVAHEKYFYHLSKPLEFTDFP
jgi:hypothetical protein